MRLARVLSSIFLVGLFCQNSFAGPLLYAIPLGEVHYYILDINGENSGDYILPDIENGNAFWVNLEHFNLRNGKYLLSIRACTFFEEGDGVEFYLLIKTIGKHKKMFSIIPIGEDFDAFGYPLSVSIKKK